MGIEVTKSMAREVLGFDVLGDAEFVSNAFFKAVSEHYNLGQGYLRSGDLSPDLRPRSLEGARRALSDLEMILKTYRVVLSGVTGQACDDWCREYEDTLRSDINSAQENWAAPNPGDRDV